MSATPKKSSKPAVDTPMRITRAMSQLEKLKLDTPEAEVKDSPPEEVEDKDEVQADLAPSLEPEAAALAGKTECTECEELQRQLDYYKATSERQEYELGRQQGRITALIREADYLKKKIVAQQREEVAVEAAQDFLAAVEDQKERNAGFGAAAKAVLAASKAIVKRYDYLYDDVQVGERYSTVEHFESDMSDLVIRTWRQNEDLAELASLLKRVVHGS
ncbi:hypothetical protein JCM9279_005726 [Rhodotorula babjevae]